MVVGLRTAASKYATGGHTEYFELTLIEKETLTFLWPPETEKEISQNLEVGSSRCGSAVVNPTSIHENAGAIPGPARWVKVPMLL